MSYTLNVPELFATVSVIVWTEREDQHAPCSQGARTVTGAGDFRCRVGPRARANGLSTRAADGIPRQPRRRGGPAALHAGNPGVGVQQRATVRVAVPRGGS